MSSVVFLDGIMSLQTVTFALKNGQQCQIGDIARATQEVRDFQTGNKAVVLKNLQYYYNQISSLLQETVLPGENTRPRTFWEKAITFWRGGDIVDKENSPPIREAVERLRDALGRIVLPGAAPSRLGGKVGALLKYFIAASIGVVGGPCIRSGCNKPADPPKQSPPVKQLVSNGEVVCEGAKVSAKLKENTLIFNFNDRALKYAEMKRIQFRLCKITSSGAIWEGITVIADQKTSAAKYALPEEWRDYPHVRVAINMMDANGNWRQQSISLDNPQ